MFFFIQKTDTFTESVVATNSKQKWILPFSPTRRKYDMKLVHNINGTHPQNYLTYTLQLHQFGWFEVFFNRKTF